MKTILWTSARPWRSLQRGSVFTAWMALVVPPQVWATPSEVSSVEKGYPGLFRGVLKSAALTDLSKDVVA